MIRKGFTLVELSISLLIIGILTGFGLMFIVRNAIEDVRYNEIKKEAVTAAEKVIQYTAEDNFTLPSDETFLKLEQSSNLAYFHYKNSPGVTTMNVCLDRETNMSVIQCYDSQCTNNQTIDNVTFAIISVGRNNINETVEKDGTIRIRQRNVEAGGNRYDDVAIVYTANELRSRLQCNNESLEITTEYVPSIIRGQTFSGIRFDVEGGKKPYRWCVSEFNVKEAKSAFEHLSEPGRLWVSDSIGKILETQYGQCDKNPAKWFRESEYLYILSRDANNNLTVPNGVYQITVNVADASGLVTKKSFAITITGMEE